MQPRSPFYWGLRGAFHTGGRRETTWDGGSGQRLAAGLFGVVQQHSQQSTNSGTVIRSTVDAHRRGKAAAERDHVGLFDAACAPNSIRLGPGPQPAESRAERPPAVARLRSLAGMSTNEGLRLSQRVGEKEFSSWAVVTSDGIIVIDAIYDYSVEEEVAGGLKKLGLDPAAIKYLIISHAHADHYAGARFLQDRFHPRVILSAADWDLLDRTTTEPERPKRDMVAADGMKLTLGDTTLTLYVTPGHTRGTISTLIPVKDGGRPHVAALWGGTMFNFARSRQGLIPISLRRAFRASSRGLAVDTVISNHTPHDGKTRFRRWPRKPGRSILRHWQRRGEAVSDGGKGMRHRRAGRFAVIVNFGATRRRVSRWKHLRLAEKYGDILRRVESIFSGSQRQGKVTPLPDGTHGARGSRWRRAIRNRNKRCRWKMDRLDIPKGFGPETLPEKRTDRTGFRSGEPDFQPQGKQLKSLLGEFMLLGGTGLAVTETFNLFGRRGA
jgi:glyoxylase-like metal-dependent hydrolase (beta-lactamase superfamily II)